MTCTEITLQFPEILFAFLYAQKTNNDAKVLFLSEKKPFYSSDVSSTEILARSTTAYS